VGNFLVGFQKFDERDERKGMYCVVAVKKAWQLPPSM
jgi:hypothetical protein